MWRPCETPALWPRWWQCCWRTYQGDLLWPFLDTHQCGNTMQYLIKWASYPDSFNSWESDVVWISADSIMPQQPCCMGAAGLHSTPRWRILQALWTAPWYSRCQAMPARHCTPKTPSQTSMWSCQSASCSTAMTTKSPWPASLIYKNGTTCPTWWPDAHGHFRIPTGTSPSQQGHHKWRWRRRGGGRVKRRQWWGASWSTSLPGHHIHQELADT